MRILSPIVLAQALLMVSRQSDFGLCRAVGAQFVDHGECQNPRAVGSLRNLRQLASDRRPADHDTINELANVGLRSGVVRGRLGNGVSDDRFDNACRNTDDRPSYARIALQSRLRYILAPTLGPLPRPSAGGKSISCCRTRSTSVGSLIRAKFTRDTADRNAGPVGSSAATPAIGDGHQRISLSRNTLVRIF
jgi:hypothetical protein